MLSRISFFFFLDILNIRVFFQGAYSSFLCLHCSSMGAQRLSFYQLFWLFRPESHGSLVNLALPSRSSPRCREKLSIEH